MKIDVMNKNGYKEIFRFETKFGDSISLRHGKLCFDQTNEQTECHYTLYDADNATMTAFDDQVLIYLKPLDFIHFRQALIDNSIKITDVIGEDEDE